MLVEHRGIYEDRFDAPFLGTMIAAKGCYGTCPGCFHQDRFNDPIYVEDADDILDRIQSNPFIKGIVLGFFEWLDYQYDECIYLIEGARKRGMEVILYTRRDEDVLRREYPKLFSYQGLYIKCGMYDENKLSSTYVSMGVPLASTNQYILKV